ncbi:glycine betaine transporter [Ferrimonas marina]|uniref:Glycine betaine transporter n=2 Tax=Ferrimonas marina TaxID=299255 RepID=A0A1M5Z5X4_9GAMM|nr:glycine betaine transporter [Ferrimonas marina]
MGLFVAFPSVGVGAVAQFTQVVIERFGIALILFSTLLVLLALGLSASPVGRLRLGGAEAQQEFSTWSWLAMLFTAGMGSGLIFWGIAEPVFHFANPPAFVPEAARGIDHALALTYFHWGVHAWAIYALAGLAIAWFGFGRGRSLHISSSFTGQANKGGWRLLDWLAIIAILFGVAGTFANTIALVQTGLQQTLSPQIGSVGFRYGLILLIAVLFTTSSILGLQRGIRRLSQFNALLMLVMVAVVLLWIDPWQTLTRLASSVGHYLAILPEVSTRIDPQSRQWSLDWSVIYLVWWVAWAPFVGPFIARISRGRTVRQFLLCVVLVPTAASLLWFSAFGGAALAQPYAPAVIEAVNQDYTQGLFRFFQQFPLGAVLSLCAILLLITFIITSADSALLVCGWLSDDDSHWGRLLWAALLVTLSMALLYINDVDLNKQVAIAGALPFTLVLLAQVGMLLRDLWRTRAAR